MSDDHQEEPPAARYLPYPNSTLSPKIVPTDLTSFKSRGVGAVEKALELKLRALQREYTEALDDFHWNKLVYESRFSFEPVIGEIYHLYETAGDFQLSMIPPRQWPAKRWVGSFRLDPDRRWDPVELAEDFDLRGHCEG